MKQRPINLHEHEAIAAAKGQLRKVFRIVKPQPTGEWLQENWLDIGKVLSHRCPFGVVGDRLWGRESWYMHLNLHNKLIIRYPATDKAPSKTRAPSTMSRKHSRYLFSIEDISVMRTSELSGQEIVQNGIKCLPEEGTITWALDCRERFAKIWNEIHGKHAWNRNDWVWSLTLKDVR